MKCYYGEVHAHTTESDGRGVPEEAYSYARDVGRVDYFATTDHNLGRYNEARVKVIEKVAEDANRDGEFAALYGYEMTYEHKTGHYGHANILQPTAFFTTELSLDEWYDKMAKAGERGIGQFNHPGEKWGAFNDFKFDSRMDDIFRLIELRITEYGITCIEEEYDRALRMGWHISPVSNEDAHNRVWTNNREETGAVLAESLSRENILDGMRKNRTYATTDRTFQLYYKANGEWIGSRLKKTGSLKIEIDASTEKECGVGLLQLVGEHNRVLAQIDAGNAKSYHWEITVPDDQKYTYVKRIAGMQYAISGAIWVEQDPPVELSLQTYYQGEELQAFATVKSVKDAPVTDLKVSWYPASGSIELNRVPYVSELADLEAGQTQTAAYRAPVLAKYTRLVAVVEGTYKGKPFTTSRVIYLSALVFRKFFCNTKFYQAYDYQVQAFCCLDIYNQTDCEIDASEYQFRYYIFGTYQDFRVPRKIAPHSTLTVWFRGKESEKTLDDFNKFYGTSLTEDQIYFCPFPYTCERFTRKVTVGYGDEVSCRAWTRSDGYHGVDVSNGSCFFYDWDAQSATMKVLGLQSNSLPGKDLPTVEAAPALPCGKAVATYAEPTGAKISRLTVLCDGGQDPAALEKQARELVPEAKEITVVMGENNGDTVLYKYLFEKDEALLTRALQTNPDALLVAMGASDCGKRRAAWFTSNFSGYSTLLVNVTRPFYTRGIPLFFTLPSLSEAQRVDQNAFVHGLYTVANTLHAEMVGVPAEVILQSATVEKHITMVPKKDAIRVAVIGDRFCEADAKGSSYALKLQEELGENYNVGLFFGTDCRIAKGVDTNYLQTSAAAISKMQEFAPQIVVSWFGSADLRHSLAERWSSFKNEFVEGYNELLALLENMGAKILLVTPFDRTLEDIRQTVNRQKDGMKDTVVQIARDHGCGVVDFFRATQEQEGLLTVVRDMDEISPEGSLYLAKMVAEEIQKII